MKDLNWIKNGYIAHRGFHSLDKSIPENSLLAFKKAMDYGYAIELDINLLKDGNIVVFHDPDLKRMCKKDILLSESNYEDIHNYYLLSTNEKIPLLSDVLQLIDGKVPLMIELKPRGDIIGLCEQFIKTMESYQGEFAIQSFNPKVLKWFKKNHPEIIRGQIAEYFTDEQTLSKSTKHLLKTMFFNSFTKPDFINYGLKDLPNKIVNRFYKKGFIVIGYTARNMLEFQMVRNHYDNAVFEFFRPDEKK